jgi:uncharacterized MAPEG superfamily protein
MHSLTPEIYWLTLTTLMTALFWVPYILNRIVELGVWGTLDVPILKAKAPWADRLMRAHANAVENLVIFATLTLAVQLMEANNPATSTACVTYFFARAAHVISYVLAIPVLRTTAFTIGFFCQMALAFHLLGYL